MPRLTDNELRFLLAALVFGAFVLSLGTLAFFPIPEGNKDLYLAGMASLNLVVGAAAGWAWPRRDRQEDPPSSNPPIGGGL